MGPATFFKCSENCKMALTYVQQQQQQQQQAEEEDVDHLCHEEQMW
jgi:hypothetical protein